MSSLFEDLVAYTCDPATRPLAVTSFNFSKSAGTFEMIVLLERPSGHVSALHGQGTISQRGILPPDIQSGTPINGAQNSVRWRDLSENLYSSERFVETDPLSRTTFGAPFTATPFTIHFHPTTGPTLTLLNRTGSWGNQSSVCTADYVEAEFRLSKSKSLTLLNVTKLTETTSRQE